MIQHASTPCYHTCPKAPKLWRNFAQRYVIPSCLNPSSHAQLTLTILPCLHGYLSTVSIQLRSPQLRQSIGSLVSALRSGNSDAVMANFGLDPAAGAAKLAFGDGTLTLPCQNKFYSNLTRVFGLFFAA